MFSDNCSTAEVTTTVADNLANSLTMTSATNVHVDRFESRNPAILKVGLLLVTVMLSVLGNSASLVVFWKTPKLHTKTFALLFNLTVVDLCSGLVLIWYSVTHLIVYVFNEDYCKYLVLVVVMTVVPRYTFYTSLFSIELIACERYIAVVLPLRYETLVTNRVVKIAVALVWILCLPLMSTFLLLLDHIDLTTCTVSGLMRQALITDATFLLTVFTVVGVLHTRMLIIALQQQAKISSEVATVQTVTGGHNSAAVSAQQKLNKELKAVRLTASVIGTVVVLWTPYLIGELIIIAGTSPILGQYFYNIGTFSGSLNCCINWIIYGMVSRDFRHAALRLFRRRKQTIADSSRADNTKPNANTDRLSLQHRMHFARQRSSSSCHSSNQKDYKR